MTFDDVASKERTSSTLLSRRVVNIVFQCKQFSLPFSLYKRCAFGAACSRLSTSPLMGWLFRSLLQQALSSPLGSTGIDISFAVHKIRILTGIQGVQVLCIHPCSPIALDLENERTTERTTPNQFQALTIILGTVMNCNGFSEIATPSCPERINHNLSNKFDAGMAAMAAMVDSSKTPAIE